MKKLMLFGNFQAGHLESSYQIAFKQIGWEIDKFDIRENIYKLAWPVKNRYIHRAGIHSLQFRRLCSKVYNNSLIEACLFKKPDWILLFNGEWIMPETVHSIRKKGIKVAVFHADNPFPPHYANRPETLQTAREVDLYLVWSQKLVEKLKNINVKGASFLPFAWDEYLHPYQGGKTQGSWPGVTFVGGWDVEREDFLEQLAQHVPLRIHGPWYWGSRTNKGSRVRAAWTGGPIFGDAAAREIRDSAISINILRGQHIVDEQADGVIMRHFEVPGAGGFLLSTRSSTATEMFIEGETGCYFTGVSECVEQCKRYLRDSNSRLRLVENAHNLIETHHTYRHRASEILSMMELL